MSNITMEQAIAVASAASAIMTVLIALVALLWQRRLSDLTLRANLIDSLNTEFFYRENLKEARYAASEFGIARLEGKVHESTDVHIGAFDVMDFFDMMAAYYHRGALDQELTCVAFHYWVVYYWAAFGRDIDNFESTTGLRTYSDVKRMARSLDRVAIRLGRMKRGHTISPADLKQFFMDEIALCQGRPTRGQVMRLDEGAAPGIT